MNKQEAVQLVIAQHQQTGKYITIEGVNLFVADQGEGPVVFCIHGIPTSSFLYRKVIQQLKQSGIRAVAIDLPGLGLSDRPEDFDFSFSHFAQVCQKVIELLQIEKLHLLLHDIGTPTGLALAANIRGRVQSITILNSMLDVAHYHKPWPMKPFNIPLLGEAELSMINDTTWPVMMQYAGVAHMNQITDTEMMAYVNLLKREDNGKAFLKIMRHFERSEEFTEICCSSIQNTSYPVQLIWGVEDPFLTYEEYGATFEKARPQMKIYKLPAKHFLQEDEYAFIAGKVKDMTQNVSY